MKNVKNYNDYVKKDTNTPKVNENKEEKKSFIIVSENNEWVGTGEDMTEDEIKEYVEEIRERMDDDDIDLLLYEVKSIHPRHV